jgi:hypothetical protein
METTRRYNGEFKAKVALAARRGDRTINRVGDRRRLRLCQSPNGFVKGYRYDQVPQTKAFP